MIRLDQNSEKELIKLFETKNIGLEGNIIKLFESEKNDFKEYLVKCSNKDKESRRKRLEITKKVQTQNNELSDLNEKNQTMMENLQSTLKEAEEQKTQIEKQNEELMEWREENENKEENIYSFNLNVHPFFNRLLYSTYSPRCFSLIRRKRCSMCIR
jgi:chromosome segregation ATPase